MTRELILKWRTACREVIAYCPNEYAVTYAKAGIGMNQADYVRSQALYVLSNIGHWHGEQASRVRQMIKDVAKATGATWIK